MDEMRVQEKEENNRISTFERIKELVTQNSTVALESFKSDHTKQKKQGN